MRRWHGRSSAACSLPLSQPWCSYPPFIRYCAGDIRRPTLNFPREIRLQPDDTGRRIRRAAIAVAIVLAAGFLIVHLIKSHRDHVLARETRAAGASLPIGDVVAVRGGAAAGRLSLPEETAAWYESTIYARVSGYVGNLYVDIGDRVQAEQLLASIDTP